MQYQNLKKVSEQTRLLDLRNAFYSRTEIACEQALLFGQAKQALQEHASPLSRAFSRDSFHSPKWESLFAG